MKEGYYGKLDLLKEWEKQSHPDHQYLKKLREEIRFFHRELVYKGEMLPNEI